MVHLRNRNLPKWLSQGHLGSPLCNLEMDIQSAIPCSLIADPDSLHPRQVPLEE